MLTLVYQTTQPHEIMRSNGSVLEDCVLGCNTVWSGRSLPTKQEDPLQAGNSLLDCQIGLRQITEASDL
jgi:hypothetical protein